MTDDKDRPLQPEPLTGGTPQPGPTELQWLERVIDRVLVVQRPLVINHIRELRRRAPKATPAMLIGMLETRYLTTVSASGAAVGASAAAPGIGTATALGLTAAETVVFLEASALFAQSVAEVHGMPLRDPDRSRALVMSLLLGGTGSAMVKRLAEQSVGRGVAYGTFWGSLITNALPTTALRPIVDQLKNQFLKRVVANSGKGAIGRVIPFGIGAVIGGVGNHILGRQIVNGTRDAFPPPPSWFHQELDPLPRPTKAERRLEANAKREAKSLESKAKADERRRRSADRRARKRGELPPGEAH